MDGVSGRRNVSRAWGINQRACYLQLRFTGSCIRSDARTAVGRDLTPGRPLMPHRTADKPSPDGTGRAALFLIHGIGEQRPYETLDALARGLVRALRLDPGQMLHEFVSANGETRSFVRLKLGERSVGRAEARELDLFEFYWAGLLQGKITLRQVLKWVAITSLTPLRSWSSQPEVLFREKGAWEQRGWVLLRELGRSVLLVLIAGGILSLFLYAGTRAGTIQTVAAEAWNALAPAIARPFWLTLWALLAFMALLIFLSLVRSGYRQLRSTRELATRDPLVGRAGRWWAGASLLALPVLVGSAWGLAEAANLRVGLLWAGVGALLSSGPIWALLGAIAATAVLRVFLIRYVGDIALYVAADERSQYFRSRAEILKQSEALLRGLLKDAGYDAVYVAGHSLGSVIAYDTLNRLIREVRAAPAAGDGEKLEPADWERLQGLLTFGSPLDKVHYFFRTTVKHQQVIRAQLLASLHGFRSREREEREESGHPRSPADDPFMLTIPAFPESESFRWWNVWSRTDRVSGHLDFYAVDRQPSLLYPNPLTGHNAYWNDPDFHRLVCQWLTGGAQEVTCNTDA